MLTLNKKEERPRAEGSERAMDELVKNSANPPEAGSLVKGTVIGRGKMAVYVDVPPFGTGIIFGREYLNAREIIKAISIGETITAKVVMPEGENGYLELSLKEAEQAIVWSEAKKALDAKTVFGLTVKEANKGGLIVDWHGLDGFLPASQLKSEHYPKVPDADRGKIIDELKKLIGQTVSVFIIDADPREGKLILSEKNPGSKNRKEIVEKYTLGDIVDGEVTGIVDFGVFVKLEENFEGLIHISEIDWSLVENPRDFFRVGDKVRAKVIEIKEGKISLSIKTLKPNPWVEAADKYKKGDRAVGVVIKYNKHGALVAIEEGVAGLIHISEFKDENDLRQKLELGKTYPFIINFFEPKTQKMTLSLAPLEVSSAGF
ncbi:MAG: S1 RNA-binding domain-containing protein [Candidatus Vogelbacteria bacterium]|nr:S1 RNA-binding domain-containing protein [Candidatus Vogelbacteria bacterium]